MHPTRAVLSWIDEQGIGHLAVHLDVDAINPKKLRPILFNKPDAEAGFLEGVPAVAWNRIRSSGCSEMSRPPVKSWDWPSPNTFPGTLSGRGDYWVSCRSSGLRFQEKCEAVFRSELRKNKGLERFCDSMKS
jgi:hypothetical protein